MEFKRQNPSMLDLPLLMAIVRVLVTNHMVKEDYLHHLEGRSHTLQAI